MALILVGIFNAIYNKSFLWKGNYHLNIGGNLNNFITIFSTSLGINTSRRSIKSFITTHRWKD